MKPILAVVIAFMVLPAIAETAGDKIERLEKENSRLQSQLNITTKALEKQKKQIEYLERLCRVNNIKFNYSAMDKNRSIKDSTYSMWNYQVSEDEMGNGKVLTAWVNSLNQIEFGAPYNGMQNAMLLLSVHPKYGKNVAFSIKRGVLIGESVQVRFGTGTPMKFRVSTPSDHSSDTFYISGYDNFISNMMEVESISIEATFYQEGNRILEFDVSGFEDRPYTVQVNNGK